MNPQTFLANFGYVANAPDGVKSLRQLVMASALAGKFSAPNDDLPSDIETLLDEARSLHFRSTGKREKPLLFAAPLIQEFEIPAGWKWVRVGQICDLQTGATPSTQRPEYWGGEIPWLASGDVNLREIFGCEGRITEEGLANSNCKILPKNSVLIALNGQGKTRATVALLRIPAACNQSLVAMIPFDVRIITPEYLFLSLRYRYYEIRDITGQDQRRGLNMDLVSDLSVPLAPLAEQNRIVAKVDELMALCDQLEAQQQERDRRFPVLSRTCHACFAEAPTPTNLNRIFDESGSGSTDDLRQTILTLAVRGSLTSQNSQDVPAREIVEKIRQQREVEIKAGRVGRFLPPSPLTLGEKVGFLRQGWALTRLIELVMEIQTGPFGSSLHKSDYVLGGTPVINPASLREGKIVPIAEMAISDTTLKRLEVFTLRTGDIVMARRGEMGRCALVTENENGWLCGTGCLVLRMGKFIDASFLALMIGAPPSRQNLGGASVGATMQNLNQGILAKMVVALPPLAFYQQLKTEIAQGWIAPPAEAEMKILEEA